MARLVADYCNYTMVIICFILLALFPAHSRGFPNSEEIDLKAILELDPHDVISISCEARLKACNRILAESEKLSPSQHSRLLLVRGYANFCMSRYSEALQDFEEAAKLQPQEKFDSLFLRNRVLGPLGLTAEGKADAAKLIKDYPNSPKTHLNMASWLLAAGDAKGCILHCNKSIALDNNNPSAYFLRASAHRDNYDYKDSLEDVTTCIRLGGYGVGSRAAANPYLLRGSLLVDPLDDSTRAFQDFVHAAQLDPYSVHAQFGIWVCYFKQGKYHAANFISEKLLKTYPRMPNLLLARVITLIQRGEVKEGLDLVDRASAIAPSFSPGYFHRGLIHFVIGEYDAALKNYNKAISTNDNNNQIIAAKAYLLASAPKHRDAKTALELAIQCCDRSVYQNPRYLMLLAMAHAASGNKADAVKFAKKALDKLGPSSHLREAYEKRLKLFEEGKPYTFSPDEKVFDYLFF